MDYVKKFVTHPKFAEKQATKHEGFLQKFAYFCKQTVM